ncbi:MAG: glutamyl-tRNA reductase [Propionibacteriales bacterium]|nr:glutamyl-tRNA reductase [Propionibacteriales bacterium]
MSVLVVGVSHQTAPVPVLERLALDYDGVGKLIAELSDSPHVQEAAVVSTCNRVEIYAEVDRFHGGVEDVSAMLAARAGDRLEDVTPHLYVHYEEGAVAHLFAVASGLDSMVVGESQILGQVREALRRGQDLGSVGGSLNPLFQQALRVGKRAHAETDIDRAGQSLVDVALDRVPGDLAGSRIVVVGAGSLAALTVTTLSRRGASDVVLANRTPSKAQRLAGLVGGQAVPLARLPEEIAEANLLISCTGATGAVVTPAEMAGRDGGRELHILDLALPRDVDSAVAELPGVRLVDLAILAHELESSGAAVDVDAVRQIVAEEVAAFDSARQAAQITPTVVALRSMATDVVDAELARLAGRLPDLDPAVRDEVVQTVRRVADKLLHSPTVRVKELAQNPAGVSYAEVLGELFSLDPNAINAVTRPEVDPPQPDQDSTDPPGDAR